MTSSPLTSSMHSAAEAFLQALQVPDAYIEVLGACLSLAAALLLALLARRVIKRKAHILARLHIPHESVRRGVRLLTPLLFLAFLSVAQALSREFSEASESHLLEQAMRLGVAWFLVRLIMLMVRSRPVARFLSGVVILGAVLNVIGIGRTVHHYLAGINLEIGTLKLSLLGLVNGIVILVFVFWLAGTLSRVFEGYLRRASSLSYNARELAVKLFTVLAYSVAVIVTLEVMGVDLTTLAVFSGALGVGIGLGLQRFTANFVSGVALLLERSIKIGDLIEVGNSTGWVRQMHMRYTLIETPDGREIVVPNEELTTARFTNWTFSDPNVRAEVKMRIAFTADPQLARRLMMEAARAHPLCLKDPPPACQVLECGDIGLLMQLTFWIPDIREGRAAPQSEVIMDVLKRFQEHGVAMAMLTHERRVPGAEIVSA